MLSKSFDKLKQCKNPILIIWLLLVVLGNIGAGSMKVDNNEIEVTGKVYVMGNEPFTQVGIETDGGKIFALISEKDKELRGLQGKRVLIIGKKGQKTPRGVESIEVKSFRIAGPK
jgi:hypothetical protein